MTTRDFAWLTIGFTVAIAFAVFVTWWYDHKTGIQSVEVPPALTQTLEQVEKVAETYQRVKATNQINEEAYIKKWAVFEKRLKQLEIQLAAQMAMLEQYKGQHDVMVASKLGGDQYSNHTTSVASARKKGTLLGMALNMPTSGDSLPAPQLTQLAKEVGFSKVEVKP